MGLKTLALAPWSGTLNTAEDPINLGLTGEGQQFLIEADNILFSRSGSRIKRGGQVYFNSASQMVSGSLAAPTDGVYGTTYWRNNSLNTKVEELVVATETGELYYSPSFNGSMTLLVYSAVTPTFSVGQVTSEVMSEKLFVAYSRTAAPLIYSGGGAAVKAATASTSVSFPVGNLVRQHISRLWVAGADGSRDSIRYSGPENPLDWGSNAGTINIYPGDGDPVGITAIFPSVNTRELYVAKRASLYRIDTSSLDTADWAVVPVSRGIGCVGQNTIASVDQFEVFFCSDRGVHSLQQIIAATEIIPGQYLSKDIQPDYDAISSKSSMSAVWVPDINSYLFSCTRPGVVLAETVYGYNVKQGGWFRHTATPANFLLKRLKVDSSPATEIYGLMDKSSTAKGYISKINQDERFDFVNSASGAITMTMTSVTLYPGGDFLNEHNFTNLIFLVRSKDSSSFLVTYSIDEFNRTSSTVQQKVTGVNILGSATYLLGVNFILGSPSGVKPLYVESMGYGNAIQVTVEHSEVDSEFELFAMGVQYEDASESQYAYRAFPNAAT
jgi:hypothetical protein